MQPNIILIVIDSLRADHVGRQVNGLSLTPNLDQFTEQCVVFTQAISQGSSTPPAMKALMSSTYPYEYDGPTSYLSTERPMIQSYLHRVGYTTAGIVTNPYLSTARGWSRDYHHYDDCDRSEVYKQLFLFRGLNQITKRLGFPMEWPITLPAETLFQRANRWLQQVSRPFFLWIQTMDVHWPYHIQRFTLDPRWQCNQRRDRTIRARLVSDKPNFTSYEHAELLTQYREAVRYTDTQLGTFLEHLTNAHILDNTVVIILADHGEEFGEHGGYFHSSRLYDVLLHVPLIIYLPPVLNAVNCIYSDQVRLIDVAPTLLELAGVNRPDFLRGASLLSILRGESDKVDRPAITEAPSKHDYAVRWKGWKYLLNTQTGQVELYHLETDPNETRCCLNDNPLVAAEMYAHLEAHIQTTRSNQKWLEDTFIDDPEVVERLRDLGYVE